jgi:hypothetical protein
VVIFAFRPTLLFLFCVAIRNNLGKPPDCGMYGNPDLVGVMHGPVMFSAIDAPPGLAETGAALNRMEPVAGNRFISIVQRRPLECASSRFMRAR